MNAHERRQTALIIRELAAVMRNEDDVDKWPGLKTVPGKRPSRLGANLFFLGCIIDGGNQTADLAWRNAQRFLFGIVPHQERTSVWQWIVTNHSDAKWKARRRPYRLHRIRRWHADVYRIAKRLVECFDGDPRRLWEKAPPEVDGIDFVRSALQIIGLGPQRSRMLVGALKDRGLVQGSTPFKDDLHVRRLMYKIGLSTSERSRDVLEAGRKFFGRNSWAVDWALFRLDQDGYSNLAEIRKYYRQRIVDRWDEESERLWKTRKHQYWAIVHEALGLIQSKLNENGWKTSLRHPPNEPGFCLFPMRGPLASDFARGRIWLWTGLTFTSFPGEVTLWTEIAWEATHPISRSIRLRDALLRSGFYPGFDGGNWEFHSNALHAWNIRQKLSSMRRSTMARLLAATVEATHFLRER